MDKTIILKAISIILAIIAVFALFSAITVKSVGFFDLSNIVRTSSAIMALVCFILAYVIWQKAKD